MTYLNRIDVGLGVGGILFIDGKPTEITAVSSNGNNVRRILRAKAKKKLGIIIADHELVRVWRVS